MGYVNFDNQSNGIRFAPQKVAINVSDLKGLVASSGTLLSGTFPTTPIQSGGQDVGFNLPLPKQLADTLSINYSNDDQIASEAAQAFIAAGKRMAPGGIQKLLESDNIGLIPEKWKNYVGIEQSNWTFDWDLVFRSPEEFQSIVGSFAAIRKLAALPASSAVVPGVGQLKSPITKPALWNIDFTGAIGGSLYAKLFKFPRLLVIENLSLNMSGGRSISFMKSGETPATAQFSITLSPSKTVNPKDFDAQTTTSLEALENTAVPAAAKNILTS